MAGPRRGIGVLLVALVLGAGAGRAAGAERARAGVPSYELEASGGDSPRAFGTGFLVRDFRRGAGPRALLLVTALHVIHQRTQIEVRAIRCAGAPGQSTQGRALLWTLAQDSDPPVPVLAWPEYDLAAIPVPAENRSLLLGREPGRIRFDVPPPAPRSEVAVVGTTKLSSCSESTDQVLHQTSVEHHLQHLSRRTPGSPTSDQLRGSLRKDAQLLHYFGPATGGASGAPVTTLEHPDEVVAIHQAGAANWPVSWALLLTGSALATAEPRSFRLGEPDALADYVAPLLGQSDPADLSLAVYPDLETRNLVLRGRQQVTLGLGAMYRTELTPQLARSFHVWVRALFVSELVTWPESQPRFSLALGAALGPLVGRTVQEVRAPDRIKVLERYPQTFAGLLAELHGRLLVERQSWSRLALELGAQGGVYGYSGATIPSRALGLLGLATRVRWVVAPRGYHALSVEAEVAPSLEILSPAYYTDFGGVLSLGGPEARFTLLGGIGVRYEH